MKEGHLELSNMGSTITPHFSLAPWGALTIGDAKRRLRLKKIPRTLLLPVSVGVTPEKVLNLDIDNWLSFYFFHFQAILTEPLGGISPSQLAPSP